VTTAKSDTPLLDKGLERLAEEIRHAVATTGSSLANRRDHPSFGYTKTMIRESLRRTVTLVEAYMMASGMWEYPNGPLTGDIKAYAPTIGVNLEELFDAVAEEIWL
jgi:hypothetical protein